MKNFILNWQIQRKKNANKGKNEYIHGKRQKNKQKLNWFNQNLPQKEGGKRM